MALEFPKNVQWNLIPSGPFISFDSGELQARIYRNTGHIEIAGPDLAGNPKSNLIHFAPPAVQLKQSTVMVGALTESKILDNGLELRQKLGAGLITSRLTFPHAGVMRYEIVDWGVITPIAVAIAAPSDVQEHFYGFGEKFNDFDQSGKRVHILSFDDPGEKQDHSYKASPWFISTRGFGLHFDSSAESVFDMRSSATDRYVISQSFPALSFNIVYGPKLPDILVRYTGYTGRPPLPPPWAFGPWISSDIWRSGGEVRYAVTQFRSLGLPASAFVFDSPWENAYNDFNFNMTQFGKDAIIDNTHYSGFSSLQDMMTFLQTSGLKVICWMTPILNLISNDEKVSGQNLGKSSNYDEAASKNFFVRESLNGPPLRIPWWKGSGSPIDFTNSGARQWLTGQLNNLITQSAVKTLSGAIEPVIGGFKTDDGESGNGINTYIPTTAHYADGRTGMEMRNGYSVEYHKTVWQVLDNQGILFARSGFIGSHAFPGSWAGDNEPNFGKNGLPSVIIAGQSAAMSGYAIWGHDTGGYQDTNFSVSPANLFMRWAQFGCFSPIMQMHRQVKKELQYPWRYGNEALDNFRFFTALHTRLFPYIYTYADQASKSGLPIIRPLVLMNQDDPNTFNLRHTFQFGNELLVAPMIEPNINSRQVYLPKGNWIDFWSNEIHTGGNSINWSNTNQSRFPVYVRQGAIVPMLLKEVQTLCDANYVNNAKINTLDNDLLFLIYPSGKSEFTLYDGTDIQCEQINNITHITLSSITRRIQLQILAKIPTIVVKDGTALPRFPTEKELDQAKIGWRADGQTGKLFVKFDHLGGTTMMEF